jgi:hypothetical protein
MSAEHEGGKSIVSAHMGLNGKHKHGSKDFRSRCLSMVAAAVVGTASEASEGGDDTRGIPSRAGPLHPDGRNSPDS